MSSVTKLELDLYYVMTSSYTKFQVNIREKSENWSVTNGQIDGQTDSEQTNSSPGKLVED